MPGQQQHSSVLGAPSDPAQDPGPVADAALVVGFGPAGIGVFTGALREGAFDALMAAGVRVVDRSAGDPRGRLGRYAIDSDSTADSFVAAAGAWEPAPIPHGAWAAPFIAARREEFPRLQGQSVPLTWAEGVQRDLGDLVLAEASRCGATLLESGRAVDGARLNQDGTWSVHLTAPVEQRRVTSLVLATGATQPEELLRAVDVGGRKPACYRAETTLGSDIVLGHDGPQMIARVLAGVAHPRVLVVGGSHSALACARVLLNLPVAWTPGAITIAHRRPLRPMYPSRRAAWAEGFTDFDDDDVCTNTGRVLPLGGFRLASRELLCSVLGLGDRPLENRVRLHRMAPAEDPRLAELVDEADLVVLATGYAFEGVPLTDSTGAHLGLGGRPGAGYVDARSRVLDDAGQVVPGLYATGLAAGYPLGGRHGEASFSGLANGTSLWQGRIGADIASDVLARHQTSQGGAPCA